MSIQNAFLLSVVIFITSCNESGESTPDLKVKDTVDFHDSLVSKVDTIKHKPIGHGFYQNAKGDIFERKLAKDFWDKNTVLLHDFLDSTIVVDDYDAPLSLKDYLDVSTYEEFSNTMYSKDRRYVYFFRAMSGGGVRYLVKNADPRSFQLLEGGPWAKDMRHVYYMNEIVRWADPKTIRVIDFDSAADRKHIYVNGERIVPGN